MLFFVSLAKTENVALSLTSSLVSLLLFIILLSSSPATFPMTKYESMSIHPGMCRKVQFTEIISTHSMNDYSYKINNRKNFVSKILGK